MIDAIHEYMIHIIIGSNLISVAVGFVIGAYAENRVNRKNLEDEFFMETLFDRDEPYHMRDYYPRDGNTTLVKPQATSNERDDL